MDTVILGRPKRTNKRQAQVLTFSPKGVILIEKRIRIFLGGNSAKGFFPYFEQLLSIPAIEHLYILKGGPGCGKSTFMRKMQTTAEKHGRVTIQIQCSSDPESLDGIIIPEAGIAYIDGTAPHITEPILCGVESTYLNFSDFYDHKGLLRISNVLNKTRETYKSYYKPMTACLNAADALQESVFQAIGWDEKVAVRPAESASCLIMPEKGIPACYDVFLNAITPMGVMSIQETVEALCKCIVVIEDELGLGGRTMDRLLEQAKKSNAVIVAAHDPLRPQELTHLLLPRQSLAFVRKDSALPLSFSSFMTYHMSDLVPKEKLDTANRLIELKNKTMSLAVSFLQYAKAHHDQLEALYGPYVDFTGIDQLTKAHETALVELM